MTQTTQWQTRDGRPVVATMTVLCSVIDHDNYLDGCLMSTNRKPVIRQDITVTVAGKVLGRGERLSTWMPRGCPSGYNRTLGDVAIPTTQTAIIEQAMIDLLSEAGAAAGDEYQQLMQQQREIDDRNRAQAKKNMAEMNKLFKSRKSNGYCPKCGSYCYGDCEAN